MTERRLGAIPGLVGVGCYVVGTIIAGTAPEPDASLTAVAHHYGAHRGAVLTGTLFSLLALAFLLVFVSCLREVLSSAGEHTQGLATATVVSWAVLFTIILAGGLPLTAMTFRGTADPQLLRMAFDADNLALYSISASAALLSVLAPSIVIWRTGVLPRWLVVLGAAAIGVNVVELAGIATQRGWNTAGYAGGVGPIIWLAWVAALAVSLLRSSRPTPV